VSWQTVAGVGVAYVFGMALTDVMDVQQDRVERPERPLPSGAISATQGGIACLVLGAGAFLLHPEPSMAGLLGCIVLYTSLKSFHVLTGALLMASCRGMALWIGAEAPWTIPLPLAGVMGFWMLLIVGITLLADREKDSGSSGTGLSALLAGGWLAGAGGIVIASGPPFLTGIPWLILAAMLWRNHESIRTHNRVLPQNIGILLSLLIPLQSLVLLGFQQFLPGTLLLLTFPLLRFTAKRVAMS
ncbi:MAG: UbiA family prenyltransferase, partial [Kiritimatiellae bacterium]|jgi:4-hydroxybenzoate polyprenyltransferase|nr:UbiA family prenyltransferase [Kiritimatiellia bacterium]